MIALDTHYCLPRMFVVEGLRMDAILAVFRGAERNTRIHARPLIRGGAARRRAFGRRTTGVVFENEHNVSRSALEVEIFAEKEGLGA